MGKHGWGNRDVEIDRRAFDAARARVRAAFPNKRPEDPVTVEMHVLLVVLYEEELKKLTELPRPLSA